MSNYAQIREMDISNGSGIGVSIFFSGCNFHCKNCFNSELWDENYGSSFTDNEINMILNLMNKNYVSRLSILGGDGLMNYNVNATFNLIKNIKSTYPNKKIWLYTGFKYEDIINPKNCKLNEVQLLRQSIVKLCDVLVDGQYIDELRDITLTYRGSSNQRVIDVQKSLEENKVVLYD